MTVRDQKLHVLTTVFVTIEARILTSPESDSESESASRLLLRKRFLKGHVTRRHQEVMTS